MLDISTYESLLHFLGDDSSLGAGQYIIVKDDAARHKLPLQIRYANL
jgi:hypothetical protein